MASVNRTADNPAKTAIRMVRAKKTWFSRSHSFCNRGSCGALTVAHHWVAVQSATTPDLDRRGFHRLLKRSVAFGKSDRLQSSPYRYLTTTWFSNFLSR